MGLADSNGSTTTEAALSISESFPVSSIFCYANGTLTNGTPAYIQFNSLKPPENPDIILLKLLSCSSSISIYGPAD